MIILISLPLRGQVDHFVVELEGGGTIPTQTAGTPFFIAVLAKDSINGTVTSFTGTVDITSNGTLLVGAGTTQTFVNGALHTHEIKFSNTGSFVLTATRTAGAEFGTSNTFEVTAGTATTLQVETAPDGTGIITLSQAITAGTSISLYAISRDTLNNFVSNINADAWTLVSTTGSIVDGDLVPYGDMKSARFQGHGQGSTKIVATSGTLTAMPSGTITVLSDSPTIVKFVQQPTGGIAGAVIAPPVTVQLQDLFGNNVPYTNDTITIIIPSGQGILSGTVTRLTDTTGLATFNDLSIDQTGIKTLIATRTGYRSDTSAQFTLSAYTITASAGSNGSITPSGSVIVNYGGSQTFTISPNIGYHVDSVIVDGVYAGTVTSYPFTNVTANHTISATFGINQYTITASAESHGTITPSGAVNVNYGAIALFTIVVDPNYHIDSVIVDEISQGPISEYTFSTITTGHTIRATFAADIPVVNVKIFLEGSYSNDTLKTTLRDFLPFTQPYHSAPWNFAGTEHVVSIPSHIVDWVLIELRSGTTASTKVGTRAAFIKQNGIVVDTSGTSPVSFSGIPVGSYYIVIRHRNHLAVMSAAAATLTASSPLYDFTSGSDKYYGGEAKYFGTSKYGMFAGDYSTDGYIDGSDFIGPDNDRYQSGYKRSDLNMDGYIDGSDFIHPDNNRYKGTNVPE